VYRLILRIIASPPVSPHVLDEVIAVASRHGSVLASASDPDVNASCLSVGIDEAEFAPAVVDVADACGGPLSAGRAYRVELMTQSPEMVSEETLRSLAVALHGKFSAPIFVARRETPAAAWGFERPMPWGRKGLAVGQTAPALPFGGSECIGVAIEVGKPTVLLKARLESVPEHGLLRACAAVGGAESGFSDVGAYPAVSSADGSSVAILEFGDVGRSPMHRTLTVLDIEAVRYGGHLGQVTLLSHVPLDALLDVLAVRTGLRATPSQVLETHLPDRPQA
jgi:hypothetical protein